MHKLLRAHIANAGHKNAFFEGETMDFTDNGTPLDSILGADNGSGKTSFLSIFFSTFDTPLNRFMRTLSKPHERFEHCFETGTAGLAAQEWLTQTGKLITGQIVTHRGKDLARTFFCFTVDNTLDGIITDKLTFDSLPFNGLGADLHTRLRTHDEVQTWLARCARDFGDSQGFYRTDNQKDWKKKLDEVGIDHVLMANQVTLNKEEGGVDTFIKFKNEADFIQRFLSLVIDNDAADRTRTDIETTVKKLERFDGKQRALDAITTLSDLHRGQNYDDDTNTAEAPGFLQRARDVIALRANVDACIGHAAGVHAAIAATLAEIEAATERAHDDRDAAQTTLDALDDDECAQNGIIAAATDALNRIAVKLADDKLEAAKTAQKVADHKARLAEAAQRLAPLVMQEERLAEIDRAIRRAAQEAEAPRRAAYAAGRQLRLGFDAAIKQQRKGIEDAQMALRLLSEEKKTAEIRGKHIAGQVGRLNAEIGGYDTWFADRRTEIAKLSDDGLLVAGEDLPTAHARLIQALSDIGQRIDLIVEQISDADELAEQHRNRAADAHKKAFAATQRAEGFGQRIDQAATECNDLVQHPLTIELFGLGADISTDAVATVIEQSAAQSRKTAEIGRRELAVLELDADSVARGGLAGIDRSVLAVVERLQAAGLRDAMPYALWLAQQNLDVDTIRAHAAADPARFSGVAVQGPDALARAQALDLSVLAISRPVAINTPSLSVADSGQDLVATVDREAAYDQNAARELAESLDSAIAASKEKITTAQARAEALEAFARAIAIWNTRWGNGQLDELAASRRDALAEAEEKHAQERTELDLANTADKRRRDLEQQRRADEGNKATLDQQVKRLADAITRLETPFAAKRKARENAEQQLTQLQTEAEALAERIGTIDGNLQTQNDLVQTGSLQIARLNDDMASVQYHDDGDEAVDLPLDALRGRYTVARQAYEDIQAGLGITAQKGDRDRVASDVKELEADWQDDFGDIGRASAQQGLDSGLHYAVATLRDESTAAAAATATAASEVNQANKARTESERYLDAISRPLADRLHQEGAEAASLAQIKARSRLGEIGSERRQAVAQRGDADRRASELNKRDRQIRTPFGRVVDYARSDAIPAVIGEQDFGNAVEAALNAIKENDRRYQTAYKLARDTHQRVRDFVGEQHDTAVAKIRVIWGEKDLDAAIAEADKDAKLIGDMKASCENDIACYENDFNDCVTRMLHLFNDGLRKLKTAIDATLPNSVQDARYRGQQILRMRWAFDNVNTDQRRMVLANYLREMIPQAAVPATGCEMIATMIDRMRPVATGGRASYGIRIIKPVDVGSIDYCPVHELGSSGGGGHGRRAHALYDRPAPARRHYRPGQPGRRLAARR